MSESDINKIVNSISLGISKLISRKKKGEEDE